MESNIAIRLLDLSKTFGRRKQQVKAVRGINLEVAAGQVYGFLGPNGAGKTTTIRMIFDLIRPSRGEVHLYGQPIKKKSYHFAAARRRVDRRRHVLSIPDRKT